MRQMKDSGVEWIGMIPASWSVRRNKTCFECTKEIVGELSSETQLLSLTTKGIKEKKEEDSIGKIPESYDTYQIVSPNDLVMCLFDLDVSAVFSGRSQYYGMISPAYKVLKCNNDMIAPRYAEYWFSYVFDERKFKHYSKNLRYTLNYDEFACLPILLPTEYEQEQIASYLDRHCAHIDNIIEKTKASIEEYKKLKQAIITQAVTKGVRGDRPMKDSGIEWIGKIPNEWIVEKTKTVTDRIVVGVVVKPADYFDENGTVPFLRGINIKEYSINPDPMVYISEISNQMNSKSIIHAGDILIVRDGSIGVSCVVPVEYEGSNAVSLIIVTCSKGVDSRFITYSLNSRVGKTQFELLKIGSALTHTSVHSVSKILHALPDLEEQIEIVEFLEDKCKKIDELIAKKQSLCLELEAYRKSMIYEYVTGKKEVPSA